METHEMTRDQKIMLFVVGQLDELRKEGFVEGGRSLSDKGRELYKKLRTEGFVPTAEEVAVAIDVLQSDGRQNDQRPTTDKI